LVGVGLDPAELEAYALPVGQVEFGLARLVLLGQYARGMVARSDICDAHPELLRVAEHHGVAAGEPCPVCRGGDLVYVSYAFGKGLPRGGRALVEWEDLERLRNSATNFQCYVVEVCRACHWNHLRRIYTF
jgi:hypothetical protein